MKTAKKTAKKVAKKQRVSKAPAGSVINAAGGVSFNAKNAAAKLIQITGGAFFGEPAYYEAKECIPQRKKGGEFDTMKPKVSIAQNKAVKFVNCEQLDSTAKEVIGTAIKVLESGNPRDLFSIAAWLRNEMNIRLTPQVLLVIASRHPNGREFVRKYAPKIVKRPDEVKTCILLHRFFFGMKNIKRCLAYGLGDALKGFNERGLLKYNKAEFPTWGGILRILPRKEGYPLPKALREYFLSDKVTKKGTPIAWARKKMGQCKTFNAEAKKYVLDSQANWEVVMSQFGCVTDKEAKDKKWTPSQRQNEESKRKRAVWEFLVENDLVGYMALMRNFRNMLAVKVGQVTIDKVAAKLSDPKQVEWGKQLPFRYVMAHQALSGEASSRAAWDEDQGYDDFSKSHVKKLLKAISKAADLAAANVPELPGTTVIFADISGSMHTPVSGKSQMDCMTASNVLAAICARRAENPIVCAFATSVTKIDVSKNASVIDTAKKIEKAPGGGTNAHKCVEWMEKYNIHPDRVILLSDMQCYQEGGFGGRSFSECWGRFKRSRKQVWLHTVNLASTGGQLVHAARKKVNAVGGFSEKIITSFLETEGVLGEEQLPTIEQIREKW